jgi:hypothetical protein
MKIGDQNILLGYPFKKSGNTCFGIRNNLGSAFDARFI